MQIIKCLFIFMLLTAVNVLAQQAQWELVRSNFWGKIAIDPANSDIIHVSPGNFDNIFDLEIKGPYNVTPSSLTCFDVNGDKIKDVLWGNIEPEHWKDWPRVGKNACIIYFGGKNFDLVSDFVIAKPDLSVANFGQSITNAGDMNGDGYDDIVVGSRSTSGGISLVIVFCAGKALDTAFDAARGQSLNSDFGRVVAGLGDVNGDGLSDIIVGAPDWKFMTREGYWGCFSW